MIFDDQVVLHSHYEIHIDNVLIAPDISPMTLYRQATAS